MCGGVCIFFFRMGIKGIILRGRLLSGHDVKDGKQHVANDVKDGKQHVATELDGNRFGRSVLCFVCVVFGLVRYDSLCGSVGLVLFTVPLVRGDKMDIFSNRGPFNSS